MRSRQKPVKDRGMRELSERDLNELARGVGEQARAQTIACKEQLKENLQKALASARNAFFSQNKEGRRDGV